MHNIELYMSRQQQALEKEPTKSPQNAASQWLRNYLKATELPEQLEPKKPKRERRGHITPTATIFVTSPNSSPQHVSFSLYPYPRNPRSGLVGLGGALEPGELPDEALLREIREEIMELLYFVEKPAILHLSYPGLYIIPRLFLFSPNTRATRNQEAALWDFTFIFPQKYMRSTEMAHQEISLYMPPFEDNTRLYTRLEQGLNSNKQLLQHLKYPADLISLVLIALERQNAIHSLPEQLIFYTPDGLDAYITFPSPAKQKPQGIHLVGKKDTTGKYQFCAEELSQETASYIEQLKTLVPLLRYLPEDSEAREVLLKFWGTTIPLIQDSDFPNTPANWQPNSEEWKLLRHLAVRTVLSVLHDRLKYKANQLPPEKQEQVKNNLEQFMVFLEQTTLEPKELTINGHTLRDAFSNMCIFFNTQAGQMFIPADDREAISYFASLYNETVGIPQNDFAADHYILFYLSEQSLNQRDPLTFLSFNSLEKNANYYSTLYAFYLLQLAWMFLNPMHEVTKKLLPILAGIDAETGAPRRPGSTSVPPIIQETAQLLFSKTPNRYN